MCRFRSSCSWPELTSQARPPTAGGNSPCHQRRGLGPRQCCGKRVRLHPKLSRRWRLPAAATLNQRAGRRAELPKPTPFNKGQTGVATCLFPGRIPHTNGQGFGMDRQHRRCFRGLREPNPRHTFRMARDPGRRLVMFRSAPRNLSRMAETEQGPRTENAILFREHLIGRIVPSF